MKRVTIYVEDEQRYRIDKLPRITSFSELVRDKMDLILEDYEKTQVIMKAVH